MRRRPPRSTRTDTLFPYTTLFRSFPSRLLSAFPPGTPVRRLTLDEALQRIAAGVSGAEAAPDGQAQAERSEEHTSELQSLMRISYADFCLKKKKLLHGWHTHHP